MVPPPGSAAIDATLLDETHDPRVRSWVDSANRADCEFPIQNLPFAVFRRADGAEEFRGGVAIGDSDRRSRRLDGLGCSMRRPRVGFTPAAALRSTR